VAEPVAPEVPPRTGRIPLASAYFWAHSLRDPLYRQTFLENFDALTPENEMKWERIQPQRGQFAFAEADALVDFAQANGKPIHGHTLIWGNQLPPWVSSTDWGVLELIGVMRDHIATVIGRYKGRVTEWDVVNEPFNDDGSYRSNVFYDTIGEGYVDLALRFARDADPDAKLYVNEIGADTRGAKAEAMFKLAERLRLTGVPIDGIGLQNHASIQSAPSRVGLVDTLRRYETLGLQTQITEMDVSMLGPPDTLAQRTETQHTAYVNAAQACADVQGCVRFTVWGVGDKYSWRGAQETPLLFDANFEAKPVHADVRDALG